MAHDSAPTDAAGSGGVREAAARPQAEPADDRSSWAPLRHAAFTVLWTAALVSNVGAWMHELSVGWLMTELDPSPIMVAIVQSAATLPMFLLALPAGAMADILDRRRLLIGVLLIAAFAALGLGALTEAGRMTPWLLVLFTLALGAAAAFSAPTWQALIPQLVPRKDLPAAVVLVGAGGNLARAVGPALGGVVIGLYGAEAPFFINAFAFVGVVAALLWWRPAPMLARATPPEHVGGAMRAGVRYALASRPLRDTLARAVAFFLFAGAFSALLPLIARRELGAGPEHYGYLQMSVGLGAIASVAAL
ncbi:MAG: MFS transporter, partial [Pseudomonadota bacterium]